MKDSAESFAASLVVIASPRGYYGPAPASTARMVSQEMYRVALFSQDSKLYSLLSSAFGGQLETLQILDHTGSAPFRGDALDGVFDCLILDLDSGHGAIERQLNFYENIVVSSPVPVVIIADDQARVTALRLVEGGAHSYCRKPPVVPELRAILQRACEYGQLKRASYTRRQELEAIHRCDSLIGSSPQMRGVFELIGRVTNLNASILITGESGTGKELVARAIHNLGRKAKRPFVAVSCGAIPETLIEAELFGHEKGAFTGTVGAREGYFEQAGDGTLFLDEIGDLSLSTQVKLLRVLQQREFCRLGSSRAISLRARLVFATNRNLEESVAEGKFRQDLYYRINVMGIECPPLVDRPEDVPLLANSFVTRYAEEYGKAIDNIQPDAMALLENYSWPGNVRELENVIQRAIIVAREDHIRIVDLPESLRTQGLIVVAEADPSGRFERQVREYKMKLILAAIQDCNGNKTLAARSLDISRAYLHRLIRPMEPDVSAA